MTEDERNNFEIIIAGIAENYSKSLTMMQLEIFWRTLKKYTLRQIQTAAYEIISTSEFFPVPAKFIKIIEFGEETLAYEAWQHMMEDMQRGIITDDPVTAKTAQVMGGWKKLSMTNTDELKFLKREFLFLYKNYSKQIAEDRLLNLGEDSCDMLKIARECTKKML